MTASWRYWVLVGDEDEIRMLIRRNAAGFPLVFNGTWHPEAGDWVFSQSLYARFQGLGGDADDPDEIDAADVSAIQTARSITR
jgi:hypothetical protein